MVSTEQMCAESYEKIMSDQWIEKCRLGCSHNQVWETTSVFVWSALEKPQSTSTGIAGLRKNYRLDYCVQWAHWSAFGRDVKVSDFRHRVVEAFFYVTHRMLVGACQSFSPDVKGHRVQGDKASWRLLDLWREKSVNTCQHKLRNTSEMWRHAGLQSVTKRGYDRKTSFVICVEYMLL